DVDVRRRSPDAARDHGESADQHPRDSQRLEGITERFEGVLEAPLTLRRMLFASAFGSSPSAGGLLRLHARSTYREGRARAPSLPSSEAPRALRQWPVQGASLR